MHDDTDQQFFFKAYTFPVLLERVNVRLFHTKEAFSNLDLTNVLLQSN